MSNPDKSKHWKSLAALLGTASEEETTEPSGEESVSPAAPVQESKPAPAPYVPPAPPAPRPAPKKSPPPAPRRPSHWGKLANVLGLAGPPEPEIEEPPAEVVDEAPPFPFPSVASDAAALAASHWDVSESEEDRPIDPLEMVSEPFVEEAFNAVDLDAIEPSSTDADAGVEERRRRRRRRRGRGRGRHSDAESTSRPALDIDESDEPAIMPAEAATESVIEIDAEFEEVPDVEPTDAVEPATEDDEGHRRRRRRRRGRRGRRDSSAESSQGETRRSSEPASNRREPGPSRSEHRSARRVEDVDLDDDESLDDMGGAEDLDEDREGGDDLQFSHKKIPSWYEAIEQVIATNMASRANSPSGGNRNRGRGRRDR